MLVSPLRLAQNLAAGLAPVAWALPFLVIRGCGGNAERSGWDLLSELPILWLPAAVLPALWFALGRRTPAAEALRSPVAGAGFALGAFLPMVAVVTGGDLRVGGALSVTAWTLLFATGLADAGTRWMETRRAPPRGRWVGAATRAPHAVGLAWVVSDASGAGEGWWAAAVSWGAVLAPLSVAMAVLGRAWPRWGPLALGVAGLVLAAQIAAVALDPGTDPLPLVGVLGVWAAGEVGWARWSPARGGP